jgi:hypothetical protein
MNAQSLGSERTGCAVWSGDAVHSVLLYIVVSEGGMLDGRLDE